MTTFTAVSRCRADIERAHPSLSPVELDDLKTATHLAAEHPHVLTVSKSRYQRWNEKSPACQRGS